jgi:hypothetical protein
MTPIFAFAVSRMIDPLPARLRIIHRAQQTGFCIDERKNLFLVPDMVAACDN